jgi:CRP/FNR family cyclic AMP-dependent transcriptional regulator
MKWPLLAGVPEEDVQLVLSVARRRKFDRGEVVFHEHDPADTLHLIDKGRFVARVGTPLGDTAILTVMGPGQMFGELSLLGSGDERRSATVAALEPSETRSVHRVDFERLRARHPETSEILIAILSGQVRRLTTHLVDALYVPAEKRVRRRLVEMVAIYDEGSAEESLGSGPPGPPGGCGRRALAGWAKAMSAAAPSSSASAAEATRRMVDAMVDEAFILVSLAVVSDWRPSYGRVGDPNISSAALVV